MGEQGASWSVMSFSTTPPTGLSGGDGFSCEDVLEEEEAGLEEESGGLDEDRGFEDEGGLEEREGGGSRSS